MSIKQPTFKYTLATPPTRDDNCTIFQSMSYRQSFFANIDFIALNHCMTSIYTQNKTTPETLKIKLKMRDCIAAVMVSLFPRTKLYVTGSTLTGLSRNSGDVDLCLVCDSGISLERDIAINCLYAIKYILDDIPQATSQIVIKARVPILRFKWSSLTIDDNDFGFQVDLNMTHDSCVRNTHLIHAYMAIDKRVTPLIFCIKRWASKYNINAPCIGTLSSYALCLMAINFLQTVCKPPVLPCLHEIMPQLFDTQRTLEEINKEHDDMEKALEGLTFVPYNTKTIAELIIDADVEDYRNLLLPGLTVFINIEEPFDLYNVAKSVCQDAQFENIIEEFQTCEEWIRKGNNPRSMFE
ncbi:hypothetical protein ACOME3_000293 [Neoechinorhynchus agilis]